MTFRPLMMTAAAIVLTGAVSAGEPVTVTQKGLACAPNDLTLAKGQAVEFVNDDATSHNVMVNGDGVTFNGGLQPPGGHVKYTFAKSGTYAISCGIHPKMKLAVTVQ